jgi:signal peptide peptidase SppA
MIDSNQLWLIHPSALAPFAAVSERAARGEAIPAAIRAPSPSQSGVAVLEMLGVLLPGEVPPWARGRATSMPALAQQFRDAAADPSVSAIALLCDSPGGTVQGTQELSDTIYGLRGSKPMLTLVNGQCCSAALWSASATGAIFLGSDTTQVGSIGAVVSHVDMSGAYEKAGIRVTDIASGKLKGAGSPHRPLDAASRAELERGVQHAHNVFVGQLARNRSTTAKALAAIADGRVFHGSEAVDVGLADALEPIGSALAAMGALATRPRAKAAAPAQHDVAARARLYAIAEQKRTGRHVPAYEAVNHILNGGI